MRKLSDNSNISCESSTFLDPALEFGARSMQTTSSTNARCCYGEATVSRIDKITGLFAEYHLFYRALLQTRPVILRSLLTEATLY